MDLHTSLCIRPNNCADHFPFQVKGDLVIVSYRHDSHLSNDSKLFDPNIHLHVSLELHSHLCDQIHNARYKFFRLSFLCLSISILIIEDSTFRI